MRDLTPSWRWIPFTAAALILLLLLASGAARFYPAGKLTADIPATLHALPLPVISEIEILTEATPEPEADDLPPPEPEPQPELFRSLWGEWVAGQALDITTEVRPVPVPLVIHDLSWEDLARSLPDTTQAGQLVRSMLLQNQKWDDNKFMAIMGAYAKQAAHYQAMKASVFNENWLEKEDLR